MTKEEIQSAISNSKSMAEASKLLNISFTNFKNYAVKYGLYQPNQGGKGVHKQCRAMANLDDIFNNKIPFNTRRLKFRLFKEGLKEDRCELCGWSGKFEGALYSTCELHHKDGNKNNNALNNLQILCPNCHSLTPNYRFRKRAPK